MEPMSRMYNKSYVGLQLIRASVLHQNEIVTASSMHRLTGRFGLLLHAMRQVLASEWC